MRHYEIVFLVHPDQSEQVPAMLDRYREMVKTGGGEVHRSEDWGRRRLAYSIQDVHKAHYAMFNIECTMEVLAEIERNFKFNDSILRHLVIRRKKAETEESPFAKAKAEEERQEEEKRKSAEARSKPESTEEESDDAGSGDDTASATVEAADDEAADDEAADDTDKIEEKA